MHEAVWLYVVRCSTDDSLYCGVTNCLERRIKQHNGEKGYAGGAKFTRSRRPVMLVYAKEYCTRREAMRAERAFKRLTREQKLMIIHGETR